VVGGFVREMVGFAEALTVGFWVGTFVGDRVGFAEALTVGFLVGEAVRDTVDFAEGFTVGFVVGRNVVAATGDGVVTIDARTQFVPAAPSPPALSLAMEVIRSRCMSELPAETEETPRRAAETAEAIVRSEKRILIVVSMFLYFMSEDTGENLKSKRVHIDWTLQVAMYCKYLYVEIYNNVYVYIFFLFGDRRSVSFAFVLTWLAFSVAPLIKSFLSILRSSCVDCLL
jgi:hypothetical protein